MVFWGQSGKWWVSYLPISSLNGAFLFLGNFGSFNNYDFLYVEFELAGGSGRGGATPPAPDRSPYYEPVSSPVTSICKRVHSYE